MGAHASGGKMQQRDAFYAQKMLHFFCNPMIHEISSFKQVHSTVWDVFDTG
jgi:hypothetical protein